MTEEIFRGNAYTRTCEARVTAVLDGGVELNRTPFYPTGGGQPGDVGVLRGGGGQQFAVVDCIKDPATGHPLHVLADGAPAPAVGDALTAEIDWDRRYRHMRMHSCLHLLCSLIDGAVTGGQIGADKGRLDFDLRDTALDKEALDARLKALIAADHAIGDFWITDDEMAARPELVRTMSVKPPMGAGRVRLIDVAGVDLQPCGGTHVAHTGEIGRVRIGKIENKGKHNRRVNVLFDEA